MTESNGVIHTFLKCQGNSQHLRRLGLIRDEKSSVRGVAHICLYAIMLFYIFYGTYFISILQSIIILLDNSLSISQGNITWTLCQKIVIWHLSFAWRRRHIYYINIMTFPFQWDLKQQIMICIQCIYDYAYLLKGSE